MDLQQIADARLVNENLILPASSAPAVVKNLGAVQSQDFWGACWALGQRTGKTQQQIEQDFNEGKILRTHILRPTWHFVDPSDIRWIQELTGPRVFAGIKGYYKKFGLTDDVLQTSLAALRTGLQGKQLPRLEVKKIYESANLDTSDLRFGFLLIYAEISSLICSGAIKNRQHTYALISDRAPHVKVLPREQALAKITERYFSSHGPATIKDMSWWSSLTTDDIKQGIKQANLKSFDLSGQTFYYKNQPKIDFKKPLINLLPNYDEMLVGYKFRDASIAHDLSETPSMRDLFFHIITQDGRVIGNWRKQISKKDALKIQFNLFKTLNKQEQTALDQAFSDLRKYSSLKIELN